MIDKNRIKHSQTTEFLVFSALLLIALLLPLDTVFANVLSLPDTGTYGLPTVSNPNQSAVTQTKSVVASVARVIRIVIGGVAVFMIVLSSLRMILAHGNEETINKQKSALTLGIVGMALVSISGEVGNIFNLEGGGFLGSPQTILRRSGLFNNQVQILITFIKYIIGSVAVLMIVRSGITLLTGSGEEDKVTQSKKNLTWAGIGLVLIVLADTFINRVFFRIDPKSIPGTSSSEPKFAVGRGVEELVGATNFILVIIGPILVLMFLAGGIMYVTSRGEEEQTTKAKKIIIAAFIGIIIVYGSFALVSTFISGQFG